MSGSMRRVFSTIIFAVFIIFALFLLAGCPPVSGGSGGPGGVLAGGGGPGGNGGTGTGSGTNSAPTANAGPDQSSSTGWYVVLDGSGSSDPDANVLTFTWSFTSKPGSSNATLSNVHDIYPYFVADAAGSYVVQLIVNDGYTNSTPDSVTITVTASSSGNTAPLADAGADQSVKTGTLVTLDGSASVDVDGDPLTYFWMFTYTPAGSSATLSGATTSRPTFTADKDGTYVVELVVNDGYTYSYPADVMVFASAPVVQGLPDTGQTVDYTTVPREDSDFLINPPSFTVNGNGTVTDNVTGLMWQQQDDGVARDWGTAINFCTSLSIGGYSDWRLPDNRELVNIVNYGLSGPAVDSAVFPNTKSAGYWSSTEYGLDTTSAWDILFDNGDNDSSQTAKTNAHYVRCVRGTGVWPVLTDNGDGTVMDNTTTLMWQQDDDGIERKWVDALQYCDDLTLGGYTDWRLPNAKEQMSLTDYYFWPFTINYAYFPSTLKMKGTAVPTYWSSTTLASGSTKAWCESFLVGTIHFANKSGSAFVRCVRGGQ